VTGAVYLSVSLDADEPAAETRLARWMESYYGLPFAVMRKVQGVFAGTPERCAEWLLGYVRAGATHLVLRSPDLARELEPIAHEVVPLVRSVAATRAA
jgi:alkanesulfonate monooxygenase SsuD/methylene tetrahydromethanopterin reductase-like flavin-dependent oxidoreductase (luciferase family)